MEAMALESLVASVRRLEGFLSVTRFPLRVEAGYSVLLFPQKKNNVRE